MEGIIFEQLIWPKVGWATDPRNAAFIGTGTAHATYPGEDTAACGVPTPFLGRAWPHREGYWVLPYLRCPGCAHRTYARRLR